MEELIKEFNRKNYIGVERIINSDEFKKSLTTLVKRQRTLLEKTLARPLIEIGDVVNVYTLDGAFIKKATADEGFRINENCFKMWSLYKYKDESRVSIFITIGGYHNFSKKSGKQVGYNEKHYKNLPNGLKHEYYIIPEKWELNKN